ncbi:hypothetical protein PALB_24950 [Pseudoalteromonas luteoviolacea B = ATCC 29581]|nr:hypothetical protein PALB_24950 [Pseudoalteromonas luteoviolacea B = ATCC 29581]
MINWVPVLLATLYLWLRAHQLKQISKYIKEHYPDEWEKLQVNPMGLNAKAAFMANMEASMLNGFLSLQNDKKIKGFYRLQRTLMVFFLVLIVITFGIALYK